jgi:hypothetical protein
VIAHTIKAKPAVVSSVLNKLMKRGVVKPQNGKGPRGGKGWFPTLPRLVGRSRYEIIGDDEI